MTGVEDAELLQVLDALDACPWQLGELEQELAAIGVQTDVLEIIGRIGGQQPLVPCAGIRYRRPAEVDRPTSAIENYFHASRIVELRFFAGLSIDDTAEVLKISPATVKREWAMAKAWLYREMNA